MEAGAFGAGKAGGAINPIEFVQRPQVILRILNIVSFTLSMLSIAKRRAW